ncbi:MAG: 16S rRNA (adenine(1518)-N(6)/adenine(1519)-N(6))-dimethyltransferase RsmA [Pseudomonadota bacterium]|mgnify:CR=1 FL=1
MTRHIPRKRFGQNFLVDETVIADIMAAIAPQPGDMTVEIGPGLGALTRPLIAQLRHLHVIEIDRDIVSRLKQDFPAPCLTIHEGDALKFDFAELGGDLRVVGNLPYNISTPILFHLAQSAHCIRDIHVMLQREVVERMVAAPSSSDYGRLSVMLQYRFDLEKVLDVPATAFRPAPQVESAVVRLLPLRRATEETCDEDLLGKIVMSAFSQRRKTLRNTLKAYFHAGDFAALGLDSGMRAQDLSVKDFVRMTNYAALRNASC